MNIILKCPCSRFTSKCIH